MGTIALLSKSISSREEPVQYVAEEGVSRNSLFSVSLCFCPKCLLRALKHTHHHNHKSWGKLKYLSIKTGGFHNASVNWHIRVVIILKLAAKLRRNHTLVPVYVKKQLRKSYVLPSHPTLSSQGGAECRMFTHKHVGAGQIGPISSSQTFSTSDKILCEKLGCLHVRNSDATIHFLPQIT